MRRVARFHLALGVPRPLFLQGVALLSSIKPNPFFIRRGFEPLPKPLANRWQGDVIDYGQRPPSVKGFLYGSQSLCPFGASHGLFTSLLSPPLEKGLKERETTKRPKSPMRKGTQWADYAKRWSMKGIDKTLGCIKKILNTGKYE